jgi:hypothetical protein
MIDSISFELTTQAIKKIPKKEAERRSRENKRSIVRPSEIEYPD